MSETLTLPVITNSSIFYNILSESYNETSKIFLPNIHVIDFSSVGLIEKTFNDYMSDMILEDTFKIDPIIVYDKIPEFYTKSSWPRTTNLKCWNCDRDFSGVPLFIPNNEFNNEHGELRLDVDLENGGVICSKNCGFTRIHNSYPKFKFNTVKKLFECLLQDLYGPEYDISYKITQSKTTRLEYGGNKTISEYIEYNITTNINSTNADGQFDI